jgi:hypothetical protein
MDTRELRIEKSGLKYVFRYVPGREADVVDEIIRLAEDSSTGLDWLDAARLGFQITQHAAAECYRPSHSTAVAREGPCSNRL